MSDNIRPSGQKGKKSRIRDHDAIKLKEFDISKSKFMGTNKLGQYYHEYVEQSMYRYNELKQRRANLFAFIMPAGHGKTYLAKEYGLVDVDMLVSAEEHETFVNMRRSILAGNDTWSKHNTKWYERMNQTLDLMDFSRPVVLMCHHEETAHELGAYVLAAMRLPEKEFEKNIRYRDDESKVFSRQSYHTFVLTRFADQNVFEPKDNQDLEATFLAVMNANNLAVAAPYKYDRQFTNHHYARTVPGWILRGERAGDESVNISELVKMYEVQDLPKECVDYYVRKSYTVTQFDFGVSMFEWTHQLAKIPPKCNQPRDFDREGDMVATFPPRSAKELARANVTVRRLMQTFNIFSHEDALYIARHQVGAPHVFVSGLLAGWKGLIQQTRVAELMLPWFRIHHLHWVKIMKDLHAMIRTSRFFMNTEITERDRQNMMYLDLLVGRAEYMIDELSEVEKRGGGSYAPKHLAYDPVKARFTNEQYRLDFQKALDEAYGRIQLKPKQIRLSSFSEFYRRRKTWLTKGGMVYNRLPTAFKKWSGQLFDAVNATVEAIEGRHNKQSFFEVHELGDLMADLGSDDFNVTKTMLKYEVGGKERVLLPGSLAHFIIFTYVLVLAEQQEQIGSVRLNAMSDDDIKYFDRKMNTGVYHVLYDWADFNEQHSADEMSAVIEGLGDRIAAPKDYSLFVEAIAWSMYNMKLQDRDGNRHKIWNGLYSGWRGTTWINTVLNFCYTACGLQSMERIYGESCTVYVDHGGDDIDLALSDATALPKFLRVMDDMLFNANVWKQMMGTRSEFFRNTIAGHVVYASATRALASFVAGDWEGSGRSTVTERITGLLDQVGKLRRRGLDNEVANGFVMCSISHWTKIKDGEEWLNLPGEVLHGHPEQGGLGVPDRNNQIWELDREVPKVEEDWFQVVVPGMKASQDYIGVVAEELEKFSLIIRDREALAKKMAEDAFDVEKTVDYRKYKELLRFKAKVVRKVDVVVPEVDEKLFEGFMSFKLDDQVMKKYTKAARYQEFISEIAFNGRMISREDLVSIMSDGEVSLEALDFHGNMYYRRLVPEFIALRITYYCREAINREACSAQTAETAFRTLCWMSKDYFGHMM
ncbi:RNA dependent RNA polymerase [Diplodia seriata chrysovirus 1]|nr:RNA dependent RNA polymerase [Diplodia seriata chrysovirus 1]